MQEKNPTNESSNQEDMSESSGAENEKQTTETEEEPDSTEAYSLRDWVYDLDDKDGRSLIHAAYKPAQDGKIFVLCEQANVRQALHVLHNIVQYASAIFSAEAIDTYFGPNKDDPVIMNHPRTDSLQGTYVTSLASLATLANPQEEHPPSTKPHQQPQPTKRKRDDSHRLNYAAAVGTPAHTA